MKPWADPISAQGPGPCGGGSQDVPFASASYPGGGQAAPVAVNPVVTDMAIEEPLPGPTAQIYAPANAVPMPACGNVSEIPTKVGLKSPNGVPDVLPPSFKNMVETDPIRRRMQWTACAVYIINAMLRYVDPARQAALGRCGRPMPCVCRWIGAAVRAMGLDVVFAYDPALLLGMCVSRGELVDRSVLYQLGDSAGVYRR
jgi:hypothetical protein